MSDNTLLQNAGGGVLANGEAAQIYLGSNTFNNNSGACEINTQNSGAVYSIGNNLLRCGLPTEVNPY